MCIRLFFSVLVFLLHSTQVVADSEPDEDFFDLPLEALGEIEVITSSRQKETVSQSPSIISVLTRKDIENLGANTLYEALSFVPGITLTETYFGYTAINVRGTLQPHHNNKVLVMINDHPTFETVTGSSHLEFMPLHMIERVEIIRGPGSALYGTNALSGVINIITRDGASLNSTELYTRIGQNNHGYAELISQAGPLLISASTQKDNGYDYNDTIDELGEPVNLDYQNDLTNLFIDFTQNDFRLNVGYFKQTKMKYGVWPQVQQAGTHEFSAYYIDAKYNWQFENGVLSTRLRHDQNSRQTDGGNLIDPFTPNRSNYNSTLDTQSSMWAFDLNYEWHIQPGMSLISGLEIEHDKSEPYSVTFNDTGADNQLTPYYGEIRTTNKSIFTQWKWQANDQLSLIAGGRLNHNEDAGISDFVPRLGAVYSLSPDTRIKLLYGEAFRNPDYLERYSESNVILGDQSLDREKIKTLDLGIDTQWKTLALRINAFYQQLEEGIVRQPPMNGASATYVNGNDVNIWGLESELKYSLNKQLSGFVNISYKEGQDSQNNGLEYIAHIQGNASVAYKASKYWGASANAQYIGDKAYTTNDGTSGKVNDYLLLNTNLSYQPSERYKFTGKIKNLLDESYTYPEYIRTNLVETPGGPGRSYYFEAAVFF
ncbi:TonB-dependent receptor [Litoribacillus peritrichatus]|uniref:TonB-dependent receptor n=1 Tax=Litoribacillus peritrichatus TaxID=718191 RepID=A0ABP7M181_9GAMM